MLKLVLPVTATSKKSYGIYEPALPLDAAGVDLVHLALGRPIRDTPAQHFQRALTGVRGRRPKPS